MKHNNKTNTHKPLSQVHQDMPNITPATQVFSFGPTAAPPSGVTITLNFALLIPLLFTISSICLYPLLVWTFWNWLDMCSLSRLIVGAQHSLRRTRGLGLPSCTLLCNALLPVLWSMSPWTFPLLGLYDWHLCGSLLIDTYRVSLEVAVRPRGTCLSTTKG